VVTAQLLSLRRDPRDLPRRPLARSSGGAVCGRSQGDATRQQQGFGITNSRGAADRCTVGSVKRHSRPRRRPMRVVGVSPRVSCNGQIAAATTGRIGATSLSNVIGTSTGRDYFERMYHRCAQARLCCGPTGRQSSVHTPAHVLAPTPAQCARRGPVAQQRSQRLRPACAPPSAATPPPAVRGWPWLVVFIPIVEKPTPCAIVQSNEPPLHRRRP
jgi:hypothetical protein